MRGRSSPELKVYGIFGNPLAHTVSPAIQNCAFDFYGLRSIYFAFERSPERFRYLMRGLHSLVLSGFNITVPFKETIIPYLNRLSPDARIVGAVNTVKKETNRWVGYNTDVYGFLAGLEQARFKVKKKTVVILGAGGSARAVLFALGKGGAGKIVVANRTFGRARKLVRKFRSLFPSIQWTAIEIKGNQLKLFLSDADLLVNTTKAGLKPSDPLLIPKSFFPSRKILVYDLIYKPNETKLMKTAKRLGHRVINGETMLLHQGARAFEIWTGKRAPINQMRKVLHDALCS
jgi:shikimate dehydrogenase